jgi:hypothetical protein
MNLTRMLVSAAVTGIMLGAGCASRADGTPAPQAAAEQGDKHACKGLNSCKAKGACKTAAHACKGQNDCKGQGGCATVKHECRGENQCRMQGAGGTNECRGKGSCKVDAAAH